MASYHLQPTEAASYGSSTGTPVSAQYTPDSGASDNENASSSFKRPPSGSLRLQTDFRAEADYISDDEGQDEGYDSYDDQEAKPKRAVVGTKYTAAEEMQVVKKFDRKLVPFLALLYLLSFLDRSNIGNAKIAGLMDDLRLSSSQYEWLLTAFYITYILFEWMTLMYRIVPPHIYISLCVCGWGLVASFQSLATSFSTLVFLRAFLGITEAAFGPGVPFYLSLFYKREELALRNGLFISAAPLATSFASSLAWLIVKVSSNGPIAPWRTLFLVEGFPSVLVAVFAWILIPDSPESARFLEPRERLVAKLRLGETRSDYHGPDSRKFNWREVVKALADPKSYVTAFMFFSCNVAFSSMPVFLPTIIEDMGYSSLSAQALCAPPYLIAFVVVLATAYLSDRHRTRSPYLIAHALISSFAYLAIAATGYYHTHLSTGLQTFIRYACVYPATSGFFSAITLIITWTMDNRPAKEGKGASMAILNLIGQCGPLLGTRLYPRSEGPWYVRGMATCSFFMVVVAVLAFVLRVMLQRGDRVADRKGGADVEMETRQVLMDGNQFNHSVEERFVNIL
ncbi:hypothetical protein ALT_3531 [Aspergillus lentulus]|uniref:Major facilitator superfamily (MFS) profile domain-containing protein n=1 Tax=Aspergillus lentulus TaxID=293939 RepID=A0AAN4PGK2_ASPLE|nr:uncharacterized protein IFM58399_09357 [Aspergillus lentulus]KAF4153268.1 hypothetical protein CNMCM6069_001031 [Aspergillus lentulus]KAF4182224.1 hypothetical protein CNMCM8060_007588 [Aspergillus lentulus]KAF4190277.1 hypothetical protein CNMCM7927_005007 [Aspergillus lentulus]KAF4199289.1 hypothetical protein CNMCM8694_006135 [Aspergillus lentulus]KAF4209468.1 hypothetical protein CNMCM8927_005868 [Aspergillus lentulus]